MYNRPTLSTTSEGIMRRRMISFTPHGLRNPGIPGVGGALGTCDILDPGVLKYEY
jgi:hypothetical protein